MDEFDEYRYSFEYDRKYCYNNSTVLKNKLGITDAEKLRIAEREITTVRIFNAKTNIIKGKFDLDHLKSIHKYIFKDIFEWAGKTRTVNISKGNMFCNYEFIEDNANLLFNKLKNENYLHGMTEDDLVNKLSYYLSEINVIHPFREGNGRTQRVFIEYLAEDNGYKIDFSNVSKYEMVKASAESFACNYDSMNQIIKNNIVKK